MPFSSIVMHLQPRRSPSCAAAVDRREGATLSHDITCRPAHVNTKIQEENITIQAQTSFVKFMIARWEARVYPPLSHHIDQVPDGGTSSVLSMNAIMLQLPSPSRSFAAVVEGSNVEMIHMGL